VKKTKMEIVSSQTWSNGYGVVDGDVSPPPPPIEMDYKGRSHCHYDPMRFHRMCEKEGFRSEMYYIADKG